MTPEPRDTEYGQQPGPVDDAVAQGTAAGAGDAQPDGGFTNLEQPSMGSSEGRGPQPGPDGSGPSVRDKARAKIHSAKERLDAKEQDTKSKFRKAFGLRQERQEDPTKWMHGTMFVTIHEAEHLPGDPTLVSCHLVQCFPRLCNYGLVGCQKVVTGKTRPPQPYVALRVGNLRRGYTSIGERTFAPKWEERFRVPIAISPRDVRFQVKDGDAFGSPHLGTATLDVDELVSVGRFSGWLPLRGRTGRQQGLGKAQLRVTVEYVPVAASIKKKTEQNRWDVEASYFQPRAGARVSLYSDSHHDPGETATIKLGNGEPYREGALWKDIFQAILDAKHFVYIAGWSVWVHNILVRERGKEMKEDEEHPELGTLLKRKAREGVKVCVLIWDDRTSVKMAGLSSGMLHTHDEETHTYFQGTGVNVGKSLRGNSQQKNFLKGITAATNFTHHQKVVVTDVPDADAPMPQVDPATGTPGPTEAGRADAAGGSAQPTGPAAHNPTESGVPRRVIAFIGGIDLCDGRYDTHDHPLFRTLQLEHKRDFYQDCLPGVDGEAGGPRLPWHDQHCRLEGPPAFDVLTNFVQRWSHESSSSAGPEALFDLRSASDLILPADLDRPDDPKVFVVDPNASDAWRVQVFRSIDSQCVVGFPADNKAAYERGLLTDRGATVDKSIQNAYIHAIRHARRFLYIENQYFLGGSGEWENKAHTDICDNLVPVEIALRCAKAVMAGDAFAAYIIIPMWPEGIPEAGSVQEVLLWQTATIRMMYRIVAKAIARSGRQAHPRDYLNIFCLGNREPEVPGLPPPPKAPKAHSRQETIVKTTRRMPIYCHAKMLIVDDEYILEGSANINQRSQDGARDTEIAMGAFQPNYRPQGRGVVYGHRMACFEEHLGRLEDVFQQPQAVECVKRVRQLAAANWEAYTSSKVQKLPHGHLLLYPLEVAQNGVVRNLPGHRHFPDTKADVTGKKIQVPAVVKTCLGRTEYVVTT